jgi:cobalamin biosynthesis protein CobD/CbiB
VKISHTRKRNPKTKTYYSMDYLKGDDQIKQFPRKYNKLVRIVGVMLVLLVIIVVFLLSLAISNWETVSGTVREQIWVLPLTI